MNNQGNTAQFQIVMAFQFVADLGQIGGEEGQQFRVGDIAGGDQEQFGRLPLREERVYKIRIFGNNYPLLVLSYGVNLGIGCPIAVR